MPAPTSSRANCAAPAIGARRVTGCGIADNAAAVRDNPYTADRQGGRQRVRRRRRVVDGADDLLAQRRRSRRDRCHRVRRATGLQAGQRRHPDATGRWQLAGPDRRQYAERHRVHADHEPAADPAGVPQALPGAAVDCRPTLEVRDLTSTSRARPPTTAASSAASTARCGCATTRSSPAPAPPEHEEAPHAPVRARSAAPPR